MTSQAVNVYHITTGWNGVYPKPDLDVESSFGVFTWAELETHVPPALNPALITLVDLDRMEDPETTIALAIMNHFPTHRNDEDAFDVARRLIDQIAASKVTDDDESQ